VIPEVAQVIALAIELGNHADAELGVGVSSGRFSGSAGGEPERGRRLMVRG